jgi:hypothetical protein
MNLDIFVLHRRHGLSIVRIRTGGASHCIGAKRAP